MAFIQELKSFINFDFNKINDIYNTLISNNNDISMIIESQIFNYIYKNPNIYNERYQTYVISYLSFLIMRLFTQHNYVEPIIDIYDDETHTNCNNKSKYYNIVKTLNNKNYNIFMTPNDVKRLIISASNFGESKTSFNSTITDIFNILTPEQIIILSTINDSLGNNILETITSNDPDSILYYDQNIDIIHTLENINITQTHLDDINYLNSVYNYQDKINYFHFSINKLYHNDVGIMRNSSIVINSQQLQKLLFIISSTSNIETKFTTFCKQLSYKQLGYIGV